MATTKLLNNTTAGTAVNKCTWNSASLGVPVARHTVNTIAQSEIKRSNQPTGQVKKPTTNSNIKNENKIQNLVKNIIALKI